MISGSDNLAGLRTRTRRYIHEMNPATSWWTDDFINQQLNNAYRKRNTQLISTSEGFFTNTLTTPVIANEPFYAWPSGFERLMRLDLLSVDNQVSYPLERWERRSVGMSKGIPVLGRYLPSYRPVGGGFLLEPELTDGFGSGSAVFESFDGPAASYVFPTNTFGLTHTNNIKEGSACIDLRKTGVSVANPTVYVEKQNLAIDLSGYSEVFYWVYFPTTLVISNVSRASYLVLYSGATSSEYRLSMNDLALQTPPLGNGWTRVRVDLTSPDDVVGSGVDLAAIDAVKIGFGIELQSTIAHGFLVDALHSAIADTGSKYDLILEYVGLPPDLADDADVLHPEFPASMEELLVLDAACSLMASESALENGVVRALARERAEWDATFARYVESRIVSKEKVDPFIGHYADA